MRPVPASPRPATFKSHRVFVTYATKHGRTFLDRELYVPKAWVDDPDRCAKIGSLVVEAWTRSQNLLLCVMIELRVWPG